MIVFVLGFIGMLLVVVAMSIGVIFGRKPLKGSCGGMAALGMETECEICGGDKDKCETEQKKNKKAKGEFYSAGDKG